RGAPGAAAALRRHRDRPCPGPAGAARGRRRSGAGGGVAAPGARRPGGGRPSGSAGRGVPVLPHPHRTCRAGGWGAVYAMCAVDALGVPAMLGRDATITSTDPHTGQPVAVTVTSGVAAFDPPETVVVYAATGTGGRSVDTCCSTINFFTHQASARAW